MEFNSISFLVYLFIVSCGYYLLDHRWRYLWLLASSCFFYMQWNVKYIVLILFSAGITYTAALIIERINVSRSGKKRRLKNITVTICILLNLGILFVFKYLNFCIENINWIGSCFGKEEIFSTLDILLPVGISFYTFQTISYVVDVYRGTIKAEKNWGYYALFVTFFPQLVAGPIERAGDLLVQLKEKHQFEKTNLLEGLRFIVFGMFKKVAIADVCAICVDEVYNNIQRFSGITIVVATVMFAVQIYCDFSGYSDIARGAAKILGFRLSENFSAPYFATSVKEFWATWHITLTKWYKDYIYIPLGGSRGGKVKTICNIFIVWLVTGIWHGAEWTFLCWGGYNGVLLILERIIERRSPVIRCTKVQRTFRTFVTIILVCCGWAIFRANNVSELFLAIRKVLFELHPRALLSEAVLVEARVFFKSISFGVFYALSLTVNTFLLLYMDYQYKFRLKCDNNITYVFGRFRSAKRRMIYYYMGIMICSWYMIGNCSYFDMSGFIYFQF